MAYALVVHCKRATAPGRVIARYERWLSEQPELLPPLSELAGKTLGCWCAPRACHGDVLARLAAEAARAA